MRKKWESEKWESDTGKTTGGKGWRKWVSEKQ
jgi:hypothetical protein